MGTVDAVLKAGVGLACAYESVAIATGRVPTISYRVGVNPWLGPVVLAGLGVHFYWGPLVGRVQATRVARSAPPPLFSLPQTNKEQSMISKLLQVWRAVRVPAALFGVFAGVASGGSVLPGQLPKGGALAAAVAAGALYRQVVPPADQSKLLTFLKAVRVAYGELVVGAHPVLLAPPFTPGPAAAGTPSGPTQPTTWGSSAAYTVSVTGQPLGGGGGNVHLADPPAGGGDSIPPAEPPAPEPPQDPPSAPGKDA